MKIDEVKKRRKKKDPTKGEIGSWVKIGHGRENNNSKATGVEYNANPVGGMGTFNHIMGADSAGSASSTAGATVSGGVGEELEEKTVDRKQRRASRMKINIREELKKRDIENEFKYEFLSQYEGMKLTEEKKQELAGLLSEGSSDEDIANFFDDEYADSEGWKLVKRKEVRDFDGSLTDYSWYTDGENHRFIFGDSDIYGPMDEADWECDDEVVAQEWFDNYTGFEEDEIEEI